MKSVIFISHKDRFRGEGCAIVEKRRFIEPNFSQTLPSINCMSYFNEIWHQEYNYYRESMHLFSRYDVFSLAEVVLYKPAV